MSLARGSNIDTGFDPEFEGHWWTVMRVAWCGMALLVLVGLTGLLGRGPLSARTLARPDLSVRYERMLRFRTPAVTEVEWTSASTGTTRLAVEGPCFKALRLQRIVPPPRSAEPLADGAQFSFDRAALGAASRVAVSLSFEPGRLGRTACRVGADGGAPLPFTQFVLP
jgi:hypothetical protein